VHSSLEEPFAVEEEMEKEEYLIPQCTGKNINSSLPPHFSMDSGLNPHHPPQQLTGELLFIPIHHMFQ
jgi:hypothetical protein